LQGFLEVGGGWRIWDYFLASAIPAILARPASQYASPAVRDYAVGKVAAGAQVRKDDGATGAVMRWSR
jgi:hypothetical protein